MKSRSSFQPKKQFQKKNTDLQDFEKLFIQPQSLANVVKLDLYSKLSKNEKNTKKQDKQKTEERKRKTHDI